MQSGIDLRTFLHGARYRTQNSNEKFDLSLILRRLAGVNVFSLSCTSICIGIDLIFSLIALGMGAAHQGQCRIDQRIPIYLLVSGLVNVVSLLFSIVACTIHHLGKDENLRGFYTVTASSLLIILLQIFNFIWLILGSIWIFQVYTQVQYDDTTQMNYCKGQIYQYAVVTIILQYVFPLVFCCCKNIPVDF